MPEEIDSPTHPSLQFLILTGLCLGLMIVGTVMGMVIIGLAFGFNTLTQIASFNSSDPHTITSIWILQIMSTTIPLFLGPVIFAAYVVKQPKTYLKTGINIPLTFFILVFVLMMVSSPLMEYLININQKMMLPGSLKWLQQWMRDKEDLAQKETQVLLQMKTIWNMLFDLLLVGLLTAVAEEFLFRGCIQQIFTRWTKNYHSGIWIAAIIFSAFHMEFFGFIPRMVLGVFFGYFVVWSGSIWTAVWAHFINNGSAVVLTYLFQTKIITTDPDSTHYNYAITLISLIFTLLLFAIYQRLSYAKAARMPIIDN